MVHNAKTKNYEKDIQIHVAASIGTPFALYIL